MANRYWVGGTGNWSSTTKWSTTSGGTSGASVPGAADTAIFDTNSDSGSANFIATVDTAITILNLTCTFNVIVTFATAGNLTVTGTTTITLVSGTSDELIINGNASLGIVDLNDGVLNINGSTITMQRFLANGAGTRELTTGTNAVINLIEIWNMAAGTTTYDGSGGCTINLTTNSAGTRSITHSPTSIIGGASPNVNVTAGTDTVSISGTGDFNNVDFTGFSGTWNNNTVDIKGSLTVSTGMTAAAGANIVTMNSTGSRNITSNGKTLDFPLTIVGVGGTVTLQDALTLGSTRTLTLTSGTLTLNNNNLTAGLFTHTAGTVNIGSGTLTTAGAYTHTAGTVNINSGILSVTNYSSSGTGTRTLNFGTGKLTLTGNNATIFDVGTATNFTTSGTVYIESTYTGGTGTRTFNTGFSLAQAAGYDVKTSGSSGIVIGTTATDIVALTGNYGNIDLTGFTNTLANTARTTYGTFIIPASGGTFTGGTSATTFGSTSSQTFTSHGRIDFPLIINGVGGSLTIQDALNLGTRSLTITNGTFNANNYNVTIGSFSSSNSNIRTLTMGSGLWTLSGTATVWNTATTTNLTFNKDTANIILTDNTVSSRTFSGGGLTYNKLTIGGATSTSTTTISGSNTFSELESTKTVAHTIDLPGGGNTSVGIWSVNGSAGNVVTLSCTNTVSPSTLTKLGGGYLSGYDYFIIDNVIGSPTDTWYVGANSTYDTSQNSGYGFFTTDRATRAIVALTSTASTTWTVPADWNNANNTITLIGGGGGGGGSKVSGTNTSAGAGGGGGGCTQLTNQSLSVGSNITYQAGSAGTGGIAGGDGVAGGTTSWNSGASTAGGGGGGTSNAATPSSTGGTAGTGTTFNGGVGGAGATTTANATTGVGGGGGAGAAGGNGAGKNGGVGFGSTTAASIAGGGGGGSNGGTAGGNASAALGGTGGNNFSGVGGGASGTSGAVGGGAGGGVSGGPIGGSGVQIFGVGSGGGGGGADDGTRTTNRGGTFGGGGGGAGQAIGTTTIAGTDGSQGAIIISYAPSPVSSGTFFQIF